MYNNISLFLKVQNMIIKKSNTCKRYLALQLKLKSGQPQIIFGLGEYRNLNSLATDKGI